MTRLATPAFLLLAALAVTGCDKKATDSTQGETKTTDKKDEAAEAKATPDAKAEPAAEAKATPDAKAEPAADTKAAEPAVIAESDYAKGIVGTWKQLSQTIVSGKSPPIELPTPAGMEMFLEFKADGGYVNRGTVQGKEHKTESTYKVEGATFRVGDNDPVQIKSMTTTSLVTVVDNGAGSGTTKYERAEG